LSAVGGFPSYIARDSHGTVIRQDTDTATRSGLKTLLETLAQDGVAFAFVGPANTPGAARFHFLDAPTGLESWAGDQDHAAFVRKHGLRFFGESMDRAIVSNRSNQTSRQSVVISSLTETANTVTATTAAPHGLRVGTPITVRTAAVAGYNGDFNVTAVISATVFQYTAPLAGLTASSGVFDVGMVDTEPFSFTNCNNFEINNLTLESCGVAKSTTDCIDLDDGTNGLIHHTRIRHSRARAITIDGGYDGQWAGRSTFRDNFILGRPSPPQMIVLPGGSLLASTTHQYCTSWVLADLAQLTPTAATFNAGTITFTVPAVPTPLVTGMQVNVVGMWPDEFNGSYRVSVVTGTQITVDQHWDGSSIPNPGSAATTFGTIITPDETKPSDPTTLYTDATNKTARIYLRSGPYTCVAIRIYRFDATTNQWRFVIQTAPNALGASPSISQYDDAADPTTLAAAVFTHKSAVADAGIELMAITDANVYDNFIDGTGDAVNGTNGYGINVVRKQYGPPSNQTGFNYETDRPNIRGNRVRQTSKDGIRIFGGQDGLVDGNFISNCGTPTARASCIRVDAGVPAPNATSDRNIVTRNVCWDDQGATTWAGAVTTQYAVNIAAGVNDTQVKGNNFLKGGFFTQAVLDSGTNSVISGNKGWVTMNKGTANIASGNTSATVAHGLSKTPALADIRVTPTTTLGTAVRWWVSGPGASNFTINVDAAPGQTITFSWAIDTAASPG
jgi:hypothetical protein